MIGMVRKHFTPGWEVWRYVSSQDDYGGTTETWTIQETIAGRMRPLSGEKKLAADKNTAFGTHRFYCIPTDIKPGDEIRKDNVNYRVKHPADMMTFGRLMQVDLEVIE